MKTRCLTSRVLLPFSPGFGVLLVMLVLGIWGAGCDVSDAGSHTNNDAGTPDAADILDVQESDASDDADGGSVDATGFSPGVLDFGGGFAPENAPFGGFGGGDCTVTRTPVVFIHGNGDEARNWDYPSSTGVPAAYSSFRDAGYTECELFGIQWLSVEEREAPAMNYHRPEKAAMIADFVEAVRAYTGASQVDVVAHSLGVTVAMHAFEYADMWPDVRRFIAIAGGMHGLTACLSVGYATAMAPTFASQNHLCADIFGFYPHSVTVSNPRMGPEGFRTEPSRQTTLFYSLRAGVHDQILCSTAGYVTGCGESALFDSSTGVRAQLNVGHGSTAADVDYDLTDWSWYNTGGGDLDGVGHFRTKNNTGAIQVHMLTTECEGTTCCGSYNAPCE